MDVSLRSKLRPVLVAIVTVLLVGITECVTVGEGDNTLAVVMVTVGAVTLADGVADENGEICS